MYVYIYIIKYIINYYNLCTLHESLHTLGDILLNMEIDIILILLHYNSPLQDNILLRHYFDVNNIIII